MKDTITFIRRVMFIAALTMVVSGCALAVKPEFKAFTSIPIQEPLIRDIANFAVDTQEQTMRTQGQASRLTLTRLIYAGRQVKVDAKYRLVLAIKIDGFVRSADQRRERTSGTAEAVVWQKLSGELVLLSWTWLS